MNLNKRDADKAASIAKLHEVVAAGVKQGLWTAKPVHIEDNANWITARVTTPEGLSFSLTGGNWNKENRISAFVSAIEGRHGIRVSPGDVHGGSYNATFDATHDADRIIKAVLKRVLKNPEAVEVATKMRNLLAEYETRHDTLRQHVAMLEGIGFEKAHGTRGGEHYSMDLYRKGPPMGPNQVKVRHDGHITCECEFHISRFKSVVAAITEDE
ncbi:MAG: hypothetical protein HYX42_08150 [Polaromonas sp.]|uniref:hypothetical protein n=1 Tax=Polaromonas sp. TaxID=1869339 RepID=UPI0025E533B9|nr:hypothetical protein [Polaromonas sp.]MBI2726206.1 hypothetical protein [Polaromonas sp.]